VGTGSLSHTPSMMHAHTHTHRPGDTCRPVLMGHRAFLRNQISPRRGVKLHTRLTGGRTTDLARPSRPTPRVAGRWRSGACHPSLARPSTQAPHCTRPMRATTGACRAGLAAGRPPCRTTSIRDSRGNPFASPHDRAAGRQVPPISIRWPTCRRIARAAIHGAAAPARHPATLRRQRTPTTAAVVSGHRRRTRTIGFRAIEPSRGACRRGQQTGGRPRLCMCVRYADTR
jgi:hypothetical protein